MQRILNADIVDITPIDGGFIYAEKKMLENGSCRVSFYSYDCETSISTPITRGEYVSCKFGQNGSRIADELGQKGEFIFAQPTRFFNNCTVTLDRAGTFSLFTPEGSCVRRYELHIRARRRATPLHMKIALVRCAGARRDNKLFDRRSPRSAQNRRRSAERVFVSDKHNSYSREHLCLQPRLAQDTHGANRQQHLCHRRLPHIQRACIQIFQSREQRIRSARLGSIRNIKKPP